MPDQRVHLPKVAQVVTDDLRRRIANGDLADGDSLPRAVTLIESYGISRPTIREAYRVLEAEQLIVRDPKNRSVYYVQKPSPGVAARYAGLLLRLRGATIGDVVDIRASLESASITLAAEHAAPFSDLAGATSPDFHRSVVAGCGNQTLGIVLGIVESALPDGPLGEDCQDSLRHHELTSLIRSGQLVAARRLWSAHLRHDRNVDADAPLPTARDVNNPRPAARFADQVRALVASGDLPDGAWLPPEAAMQETYGVSRSALREGLRILESEGLVTVKRGARGGAVVTHPQPDQVARYMALLLQSRGVLVNDFFEARSVVETLIADRAARRGGPTFELRRALAEEAHVRHHPGDFAQASVTFHHRVAEASGSPTLNVIYLLIDAVMRQAAEISLTNDFDQARVSASHDDHTELIDLIEAEDPEGARALWRRHSRATGSPILRAREGDLLDFFGRPQIRRVIPPSTNSV